MTEQPKTSRSLIVRTAVRRAFAEAGARVPRGLLARLTDLARGSIARAIEQAPAAGKGDRALRFVRRSTAVVEIRRRIGRARVQSRWIEAADRAVADVVEREAALRRRDAAVVVECISSSDLAAVLAARRDGEPMLAAARRLGLARRRRD